MLMSYDPSSFFSFIFPLINLISERGPRNFSFFRIICIFDFFVATVIVLNSAENYSATFLFFRCYILSLVSKSHEKISYIVEIRSFGWGDKVSKFNCYSSEKKFISDKIFFDHKTCKTIAYWEKSFYVLGQELISYIEWNFFQVSHNFRRTEAPPVVWTSVNAFK